MRREPARRSRTARSAFLAVAAAWPVAGDAYRPFNSTDAAVAAAGEMVVEVGPLGYMRQAGRTCLAPSLALGVGLAEGWEATLDGRHFVHLAGDIPEPGVRVEEVGVFLKRLLRAGSLQGAPGVSLAAELGALIPTAAGEGAGAEATIALSHRWKPITLHLDAAMAWTRSRTLGAFGGIALEGPDRWEVRPVVEVFAAAERGAPTTLSGMVGAVWRVRQGLSVDVGARVAYWGTTTTEIRAGLTFVFGIGPQDGAPPGNPGGANPSDAGPAAP